ncbi:Ribonuclease H-like domain [Cinara cedri]|uniref:Ribonuclease H-like domain n=1 Tax=Cinara cedri TaxID=506608 RepID=A0A5E4MQ48_9HEMI|nr:Ribonuclease H-like domain [Cinara cedri]
MEANNNKMEAPLRKKVCNMCNTTTTYKNWSRHLRTIKHQKNDPDSTIEPRFHEKTKEKIRNRVSKPRKERTQKPHRVFSGFQSSLFERKKPNIKIEDNTHKKSAFNRKVLLFVVNKREFKDINQFLNYSRGIAEKKILGYLKEIGNLKINISVVCRYIKRKPSHENFTTHFTTENKCFYTTTNFNEFYSNIKTTVQKRKDVFIAKGSSWIFKSVLSMEINMYKNNSLRGGSYIELPKWISLKKAIDIPKFEGETNISINAFTHDNGNIVPLQLCKVERETYIDLFYLSEENKEYYCLIKNFSSFCYNVTRPNSIRNNIVTYSGKNAVRVFYEKLKKEALYIAKNYFDINKPMVITKEQEAEFERTNTCFICERSFNESPPTYEREERDMNINKTKVRDHDHLTGKYRGAAHSICNLKYKVPRFIPVFFHNLSGYDAHLFIKEFGINTGDIKVISNSEENYITFSKVLRYEKLDPVTNKTVFEKIELRFLDSFKFLSSSLDKLASTLEKEQCKHLSRFIENKEQSDLVKRKLAYSYEYMDSPKKYNETSLPPMEKFFSSLTGKHITFDSYENAQKIWASFKIKNLREFTILYNTLDVLLLSDIMENYREVSLGDFKLDPAHYFTTPGFAWGAMLKKTSIKLELITDIDMHLLFEQGIRGGLSQCSTRHSKANNKYITGKCEQPGKYLLDLDANNLYGWAMCKYLPYKELK